MVNKTALAVLGVIVVASMGVGVLVGTQMGESPPADGNDAPADTTATGTSAGESGTPTPVPTVPETTRKETVTGTETSTTAETTEPTRTTVAPRRFDEKEIAREVKRLINEERADRGLDPLRVEGNTVDTLDEMATEHSVAMADADEVDHTIDGTTSKDRYEAYGVYNTCTFTPPSGGKVINAKFDRLETVDWTVAGREYSERGEVHFHPNETAVATSIVSDWVNNIIQSERLFYENAGHVGVGIEMTRDGEVFATANMC